MKKFRVLRYIILLSVLFVVFFLRQWSKGNTLAAAAEFGLLWSFAVTALVAGVTRYYARKGRACALCDEMADEVKISADKERPS